MDGTLEPCFTALGFTTRPRTAEEIVLRFWHRIEQYKDSTHAHRSAREALRRAKERCIKILTEETNDGRTLY